jgi:hypothetical protein
MVDTVVISLKAGKAKFGWITPPTQKSYYFSVSPALGSFKKVKIEMMIKLDFYINFLVFRKEKPLLLLPL